MSASRAIASAKNKRAGLNSPNPANPLSENQSQYNPTSFEQLPPAGPVTKLTIPQAIQMIISRLDVIDAQMVELTNSIHEVRDFSEHTQSKYLVDASVFDSIVSRVNTLESNPIVSSTSSDTVEDIKRVDATIQEVKTDIVGFKNSFISLQSYVMETNAKLTEVVFSLPIESMVDYRDIFTKKNVEGFDLDDVNITNISDIMPLKLDETNYLKEPSYSIGANIQEGGI